MAALNLPPFARNFRPVPRPSPAASHTYPHDKSLFIHYTKSNLTSSGAGIGELINVKFSFSISWNHVRNLEIELHSFLTLVVSSSSDRFNPRESAVIIRINFLGGWLDPRDRVDVSEKRKILSPCQNLNHESLTTNWYEPKYIFPTNFSFYLNSIFS